MNMRSWQAGASAAALVVTAAASGIAQAPAREALDGADPVLLVQGRDVIGTPQFKVVRGRFEYWFTSAETKAIFERDPGKYEIQLGGLCAKMGGTTTGNPSDFVVHERRIYVFGSDDCHKQFAASPAKFLPPKPEPMPTSAEAAEAGRALTERAAQAIGGDALDTLTSYVETASLVQQRMDGDVPVSLKTMWRFPDAVRAERSLSARGRTFNMTTILKRDGAWTLVQGGTYPVIPEGLPSLQQEHGRRIVPLLRARKEAGFEAVSIGRGQMGGADVERVRIRYRAIDATLAVDPVTSRVHAISYTDRSASGEYGVYTIIYSDYRPTAGLRLPYKATALFNGQEDTFASRTIESIAVNVPLDRALFDEAAGK
jgi:YHS domain-containing protein